MSNRRMSYPALAGIILKGFALLGKSLVSGERLPNHRMPSAGRILILMVFAVSLFNVIGICLLAQPCDPKGFLCPPEMQVGFLGRCLYAVSCFAPLLVGAYGIGLIAVVGMIGMAGDYLPPTDSEGLFSKS